MSFCHIVKCKLINKDIHLISARAFLFHVGVIVKTDGTVMPGHIQNFFLVFTK